MKRSKKYKAAAAKIEEGKLYMPLSAMKIVKEKNRAKTTKEKKFKQKDNI